MKTSIANMFLFFLEQEKHDEISSFGFMTVSRMFDQLEELKVSALILHGKFHSNIVATKVAMD